MVEIVDDILMNLYRKLMKFPDAGDQSNALVICGYSIHQNKVGAEEETGKDNEK